MWADSIVTRHIGGKPFSKEESWSRLLRYAGHWALLGFGYWVIEERATGKFVGEVGFADYKRDLETPYKDAPEIGWVIASQFHGKGYATEAVHAAIAWGDANFGSSQTACIIHPENRPSIRVAERCGYREFQLTTCKGQPTLVFVR
jgi:RimJ/RimL family protein N-acetyltransferase